MVSTETPAQTVVYLDPVEELAKAAYETYAFATLDDYATAKPWSQMLFDERHPWRQVSRAVIRTREQQSRENH